MWTLEKRDTWVGWGEGKKTVEKGAGVFVMKEIYLLRYGEVILANK